MLHATVPFGNGVSDNVSWGPFHAPPLIRTYEGALNQRRINWLKVLPWALREAFFTFGGTFVAAIST